MKKYDEALEIDVVKELANEVCANYFKYMTKNNIDTKKDSDNEVVKTYLTMVRIKSNDVYKCNNADDFENLKRKIIKARTELDELK